MNELAILTDAEKSLREIFRHLHDAGAKIGLSDEQLLLLVRMPAAPSRVGVLLRTAYFGTNASYNVRALIEKGFVAREADPHDCRASLVSRTRKGDDAATIGREIVVREVRARAAALQSLAA